MPPCLPLSIIRYGTRLKWMNLGNGVAPSPTPRSQFLYFHFAFFLQKLRFLIKGNNSVCKESMCHDYIEYLNILEKTNQSKEVNTE